LPKTKNKKIKERLGQQPVGAAFAVSITIDSNAEQQQHAVAASGYFCMQMPM
jgi:hypothetical protein